jgi:hemerythrin-like domain-containing protein
MHVTAGNPLPCQLEEKGGAMEPREDMKHQQKEHQEILRLTDRFEEALSLASREDFTARQIGLAELRNLQHGLMGISQHCSAEDGLLESEYRRYLDAKKYARIRTEHEGITRLIASLLRELPFVTADSVVDTVPRGQELVERIREHVAYEEEMLSYIEDLRLQIQ